ncbi:MAG: site-specific recombinase XerD [Desulforhopalus sp.]|jgi:site-specific recombinase XerD
MKYRLLKQYLMLLFFVFSQSLRNKNKIKLMLYFGLKIGTTSQLSYSTAWGVMRKTLERAGLVHKKYSLHSLRHTFEVSLRSLSATDMINAGMRIEVLRQLLGHKSIELTMRYAKISSKTRELDYFRAMQIIEHGGNCDEPYRISNALQKIFEEKQLLQPHD